MRLRRVTIAGAVLALVGSVITVVTMSGPDSGAPPVHISEAPDEASAVQAAWRQGTRVEILNQRAPDRSVFANPGGTTTAEFSAAPTRVKQGNTWSAIDRTMVKRGDGSVGPKAAIGELTLSGGGKDAPLARLTKAGHTFSIHWPDSLPAPVLSGERATYPEVFPGVDLVMLAGVNGYQQHLVIKNAEAARNPALASVRLPIRADGLKVSVDDRGAVLAVDEAGIEVFTAPPSEMWDSAEHRASVGVSLVDGSLVLAPDQKFLADPGVSFPVTVDPNMSTYEKWGWATVLSGKPNDKYWWTSGETPWSQVGQCNNSDGRCNGIAEAWAYFQYDTGGLWDRTILRARFLTTVVYSPGCTERNHELYRAGGGIWDGMTWNSKPVGGRILTYNARKVSPNWGCPGYQGTGGDIPVTEVNKTGHSTYYMKAAESGDQLAWRKYDPGATKLEVTYNRTPNVPTNLATDPPLPAPCKWCGGLPYIGQDNIRLIAQLSDPDGDALKPQWRTRIGGVEKAWDGDPQGSGAFHDTNVRLVDHHGKTVGWWLHATDDVVSSDAAGGMPFVVDRVGVDVPPTISGVLYQEDNKWHGGVDVADTFTFGPSGVDDIDHYLYGWQDPPSPSSSVDAEALGGSASIRLAPPGDGPQTLFVQSVDRAGHRSRSAEYHIYVRAGNGPLSQWSFDGNTNDTAFQGNRHATLNGNATYTAQGAVRSAVSLDGQPATYVSAPTSARTDASYSVATWVKLSKQLPANAVATAVSQQSGNGFVSGYFLGYRNEDGGKWDFYTTGGDQANRPGDAVVQVKMPANLDTWTHLAAIYDAQAKQIKLYVNGELKGTAASPNSFNATGPVMIGRGTWNSSPAHHWPGAIDEVQIYDRVLSGPEIAAMVSRDNVQASQWKFEEGKDNTARNSVEGGKDLVLSNGAAFTKQGIVGGAVQLDGEGAEAATSGPVVRTDQSFSVSAWVTADSFVTDGMAMTAVSQDGLTNSGFYLQYNSTQHKWVFMKFTTDDTTPNLQWIGAAATQQPALDTPTHLTGTFNADTRELRIYVDGEYGNSATLPNAPWDATGPLVVGRAKHAGNLVDHWPGMVDEVRLYNRTLTEEEVRGLLSRDNVTAGTWKLDGNANDTNEKLNGTLVGPVEWSAGQTSIPDPGDLAMRSNGNAAISAGNAVDTDKSFSVTAWARLDKIGTQAAVVSQDGQKISGFDLRALSNGKWNFWVARTDDTVLADEATGPVAQLGVWTHLAGVYSKDRQRIELYVNGVLAGSTTHTAGFDANGGLQIGRSKWNGPVEYFTGAIDDVSVYTRPLFANEIQAMAGRDLSLGHQWTMDEGSGTSTADSVGSRAATLEHGPAFVRGRVGNAIHFDGKDDVVTTPAVDVRTDASFTISAWVSIEGNDCDEKVEQRCMISAVSLDGGGQSTTGKFRLGHVKDTAGHPGNWVFEVPEPNGVNRAALSVNPEETKGWAHLLGVYEAGTGMIFLYVNGTRKAEAFMRTPWQGSGGLRIGSGKVPNKPTWFWRGTIDDVRMYATALTSDRISALYKSYPSLPGADKLPVADAGYWKFDESSGTTAADSSGRGLTATLKGGAGWNPGRSGNTSWLDGTSGYVETAGPVVDTSASFSVAAWASMTDNSRTTTVFGQDGNHISAFSLRHDTVTKTWQVVVPLADQATNTPSLLTLQSDELALGGTWTHLTLVYEAPLRQIRLYVNGRVSAVQVGVSIQPAPGKFSVGRCKWNDANGCYFPRGVDDVRVFRKALSDGEVRTVHDDVPLFPHGYWRFDDGTAKDYSWRNNPTTLSGGTSFTDGVTGKALQLDGNTSGVAQAQHEGVSMHDSFTVSAWAKLTRTDKVATVLSQDGSRMSAFQLQYRPEVNRWIFGGAARDEDLSSLAYANSLQPPALNVWTHLTGVYDVPARQLRLYVNGEHVGSKDNVLLWRGQSNFAIGRSKVNGNPAEYFTGAIDEVTTDHGVATLEEIRIRGGFPAPASGQVGRFVNDAGDRYTASSPGSNTTQFAGVPAGYRFERSLGIMLTTVRPGTRRLYACLGVAGEFTSTDPSCEGSSRIAELGWVFQAQPSEVATVPLQRCKSGQKRFDSNVIACENGAAPDGLLGYVLAYAPLTRYHHRGLYDFTATTNGTPPGYRWDAALGFLAMTDEPGTQVVMSCVDDVADNFLSLDPACAQKKVIGSIGRIWTAAPPGLSSHPIFRCALTGAPVGQQFVSQGPDCEGQTVLGQLGYTLAVPPGPTPS